MNILPTIFASILAIQILPAADSVLGEAEHGELKEVEGKVSFVPNTLVNEERIKSGDTIGMRRGWDMIGPKIYTKPHHPTEYIISGGLGNYNIGMMAPSAGIPVFLSIDDQRPTLVGITDANGLFAIKLPDRYNGSEIWLYFTGEVDVQDIPYPNGQKRMSKIDMKMHGSSQVLTMKIGTSTVRFKLRKEAEQAAPSNGGKRSSLNSSFYPRRG